MSRRVRTVLLVLLVLIGAAALLYPILHAEKGGPLPPATAVAPVVGTSRPSGPARPALPAVAATRAGAAVPHSSAPPLSDEDLQAVLDRVEQDSIDRWVYTIGRNKAVHLARMIRERAPGLVVECGTALGFSGMSIARELKAAGTGHLITIELRTERAADAIANFRAAGLDAYATILTGNALDLVDQIDGEVDFVFMDCGLNNYAPLFAKLLPKLSAGAIVVADNISVRPQDAADYFAIVRTRHRSRTEWFDTGMPWRPRDAWEVTVVGE